MLWFYISGCVLNFLQDINDKQNSIPDAGPIIVHCRFVIIYMFIEGNESQSMCIWSCSPLLD